MFFEDRIQDVCGCEINASFVSCFEEHFGFLTPYNHRANEVHQEEDDEFALGIQKGGQTETGTWVKIVTSLLKNAPFTFLAGLRAEERGDG